MKLVNDRYGRCCWLLWLLWGCLSMQAQDRIPSSLAPSNPFRDCDTLVGYWQRSDTLSCPSFLLPASFLQMGSNELDDNTHALNPFWEKLRLLRADANTDTVRVVHVGDSHVRGHIFPRTTGEAMQATFGALSYVDMGINGAFCTTFTRPDRIQAVARLHPDLIVLSLGTNESHNRRYDPALHRQQLDDLMRLIRQQLPDVPVLLTTPPGSYESVRRQRRRRTYHVNPRTALTVQTILRYAADHDVAVWNLYGVAGGEQRACLNWQEAGLMRPDHVHYLPDGYRLQGEWLFQALVRGYNRYVQDVCL